MLERFKPLKEDMVRISEPSLRRAATVLFEKVGVSPEDAVVGADTMVMTDLRGVESHGVSNMLRAYLERFQKGEANPRPNWKIVRERPGTATIDGDRCLVTIMGPKFMNIAIEKAKKVGVGVVTVTNSGHSGAIGHHAMIAAKSDMIGMTMSAGGTIGVPPFGAEGRFGTNPIAVAVPARAEAPFLFDVATTAVAGNKIRLAQRVGAKLLPGWIADKQGNPIMEEVDPLPFGEFFFLPFGGTRENGGHKGYGFSMTAEIMATVLSGSIPALAGGKGGGHFFAAYSIDAFMDVDEFKDRMDRVLCALRTTRPAPGHDRVLYPGLSEYEEEQDRRANGIPLHKEVVEWFQHACAEFNAPPLERI